MTDTLYRQELLDHYKYPRNKKEIANPTFNTAIDNPSCGDKIAMQGIVQDKKIIDLGFAGSGCVISQAAASMLTEHCIGKDIHAVLAMTKDDILALVGIPLGPSRLRCALISLEVLQQGLKQNKK